MTARRTSPPPKLFDAVAADLRDNVDGEIRFDPGSRAAYSTDASNYRQVPIGVVVPRNPAAATHAIAVCCQHDVPVLSRGGGTSLAGQCCNAAVVIDWSKYSTRIDSIDTDAGIAVVEPGIKLDTLNDHLQVFGPTIQSSPRLRDDPGAPGCLPGLRPDRVRDDRFRAGFLTHGTSDDGGRDEFDESAPSRRSNSATRSVSCVF